MKVDFVGERVQPRADESRGAVRVLAPTAVTNQAQSRRETVDVGDRRQPGRCESMNILAQCRQAEQAWSALPSALARHPRGHPIDLLQWAGSAADDPQHGGTDHRAGGSHLVWGPAGRLNGACCDPAATIASVR